MKKTLIASGVLCAVIGLGLGTAALGNNRIDGDPGMMVSPHMIILSKTTTVTVHTNIPYYSVLGTVTLNSDVGTVPASRVWADDCGHLAARFYVEGLSLKPSEATLTLIGVSSVFGDFEPKDVVRVKE